MSTPDDKPGPKARYAEPDNDVIKEAAEFLFKAKEPFVLLFGNKETGRLGLLANGMSVEDMKASLRIALEGLDKGVEAGIRKGSYPTN